MRFLIVNADDFGLTAGINRAVIDGHTRGIITSATIMANMPAFDHAVILAKKNPSLGIGLHFNVTQGRPLAEVSRVRSLTNNLGEFLGTSTALARRLFLGRLRVEEVVIELRAQIEKALDAGLCLTHIDSHKHAHALPQVCAAIIETIKDYGIGAVRSPREDWSPSGQFGSFKLLTQSIGALGLAQLCRISTSRLSRSGVKTTEAFFGISQTGFWTRQWLRELIEQLPEGVSELMCHPGYVDDQLENVKTRLRQSRMIELQLLTDPEIMALVNEEGVQLVNYSFED
ncbi:MAG: ChbG/HpnK family deacetylase [Acidobacteria bacterium]|nr:ChbG/HpnK family deacetylase [Acidobacteriota bacterium]MCI0666270.1 ChbG/HpnK family deacetylase [Acidobacteriota bacterium]